MNIIVNFLFRTDVQELPSNHEALDEWLQNTWTEKEQLLATFHGDDKNNDIKTSHLRSSNKDFAWQGQVTKLHPIQYPLTVFEKCFFFSATVQFCFHLQICWLYFMWWFVTSFLTSFYGLMWTVLVSCVSVLASKSTIGGLHEIEAALERKGTLEGLFAMGRGKND